MDDETVIDQCQVVACGGGIEVSVCQFGIRISSSHMSTWRSVSASRAPSTYWNCSFLVETTDDTVSSLGTTVSIITGAGAQQTAAQ